MIEDIANRLGQAPLATDWSSSVFRLLAAALLGGAIGLERELLRKPAGLRTHILVALGACLFCLLTFEIMVAARSEGDAQTSTDPIRIIEAVTAGVAFLAAGTIFTSGGSVTGLTTGAGMWMAGAIGVACGIGQLMLALLATVIVLVVLVAVRWLERLANRPEGD